MRLRLACGLFANSIAPDPARRSCAQLRGVESGVSYSPTTCFETSPFPRPTWLAHAHAALDTAVVAAYGWPASSPSTRSARPRGANASSRAAAGIPRCQPPGHSPVRRRWTGVALRVGRSQLPVICVLVTADDDADLANAKQGGKWGFPGHAQRVVCACGPRQAGGRAA
jgi:hypothetical protein